MAFRQQPVQLGNLLGDLLPPPVFLLLVFRLPPFVFLRRPG